MSHRVGEPDRLRTMSLVELVDDVPNLMSDDGEEWEEVEAVRPRILEASSYYLGLRSYRLGAAGMAVVTAVVDRYMVIPTYLPWNHRRNAET